MVIIIHKKVLLCKTLRRWRMAHVVCHLWILYHKFPALAGKKTPSGFFGRATAEIYNTMFSHFLRQRDKSAYRRFANSKAVCL